MKQFEQIKQGILNFWISYTENYFQGENLYITISLIIFGCIAVFFYYCCCFKLIRKASQKQNHILVLFGILLTGVIPGIIYYIII